MMSPPAIDAVLARTLRLLDAGKAAPWPELGPYQGEKLRAVWIRVDFHGIAVLLNANAGLLHDWPEPLLDQIAEEARIAALWEVTHAAAVSQLIESLNDAGVKSVVLKGTALAYSLHDDPAVRRRGDSDVLVRPADLDMARKVFDRLGWYRSDSALGLNRQEGWLKESAGFFGHMVDLHWAPTDNHSLRELLNIDDCLGNREPLPHLHARAYRPDMAFLIVHATINQAWHAVRGYRTADDRLMAQRRLIWSMDFKLMVRAMSDRDRERLYHMCERSGAGPLVAEALRGAARDLEFSLPQAVLDRLDGHTLNPVLAALFLDHDTLSEFWLDWRAAPDWGERGRMLVERALPPRAHLERKYPEAADWPVAVLRARLILGALARSSKRALRRVARALRPA